MTTKSDCGHRYSKAMNQPYPRLCTLCGQPEIQQPIELIKQPDWDDILFDFIDETPPAKQSLLNFRAWAKAKFNPPTLKSID
jgi:hypothetical protein